MDVLADPVVVGGHATECRLVCCGLMATSGGDCVLGAERGFGKLSHLESVDVAMDLPTDGDDGLAVMNHGVAQSPLKQGHY